METTERPAIIMITCDELNRKTLGCYGGKGIATPNIDSLAEEGTNYENCYTVSPWCLPSRCAILTSRYPHDSGAYSNFRKCALDVGISNLFQSLRESGYNVSVFGKCHFAPVPYSETRADRTLPYEEFRAYYKGLGIDHLELQDDKQVSVWFYDDYSKELDQAGYLKAYRDAVWNADYKKVFPFPGPACWHPDAWTGRKAVEHIQSHEREKPLFAWVSFSGPHYTFDAPKEYLDQVNMAELPPLVRQDGELDGKDRIHHDSYFGGSSGNVDGCRHADGYACKNYTDEYWDGLRRSYYGNVKLIDDWVGEIIKAVKAKYGDNALILFSADHGEMLGNHGLWGKHNCAYEEVWHIPLLVKYPGGKRKAPDRRLVNTLDLLPTCLEAAGAAVPICDGHSLRDLKWKRNYTFAEGEGYLAVTDGRYKYVHVQKGSEHARELLDLQEDPNEFENRISLTECQAVLASLREKMIEHMLPSILK